MLVSLEQEKQSVKSMNWIFMGKNWEMKKIPQNVKAG